ncbi:hypothetical protein NQ318_004957 [Aromia moschata]|uniref:Cytochrome P450 n=1 Tax=Aromia moschata TaxID=1265417 RepID=A0AAV8XCE0_9CUCU|nr:hypothetical protein NQ318_004957 [Aromia moschata]
MGITSGSLMVDLIGVFVALVAVIYAYFKWSYQYWNNRNVPYLEPTIPFGSLENAFNKKFSESEWTVKIYTEAKSKSSKYCGMYIMTTPNLLILDMELLKKVLTKDFTHFTDRGIYVNEKDDPLSAHLFTIGGTKWKTLRTKLSPTFTSGKLKAMIQTLMDAGVILENHFLENVNTKDAIDIKDVLARFTTDIIGSCAFGIECNSFKEPDSPFRRYGKRALELNKLELVKNAFNQNFKVVARALGSTVVNADVSKFFMKVVEDVVAYRKENQIVRKDFLQLLIDMKKRYEEDGLGDQLTMNELAAQCFVFFLGGFETSSTTMTFALFELSTHQDIQDKAREEIKAVLAKHDNKMTYDSLSEMKYLKQVIDETLRKYPPVPFITRECVKEYKVPDDNLTIEKGIICTIPIRGIHYDEKYFENPNEFNPHRFSEDNKKTRHPYSHLPFGEGPRVCIGERFGIMQIKIGLASILKNFNVKLHEKTNLPLKMDVSSFVPNTDGAIWLSMENI